VCLVSQSIRDLQALLAFFVCDSAVMGPPATVGNTDIKFATPNLKFGDNLCRHQEWEAFLEVCMYGHLLQLNANHEYYFIIVLQVNFQAFYNHVVIFILFF
jgi:hypothetical protein